MRVNEGEGKGEVEVTSAGKLSIKSLPAQALRLEKPGTGWSWIRHSARQGCRTSGYRCRCAGVEPGSLLRSHSGISEMQILGPKHTRLVPSSYLNWLVSGRQRGLRGCHVLARR